MGKESHKKVLLALDPFLTLSSLKSYIAITNTFLQCSALVPSALNEMKITKTIYLKITSSGHSSWVQLIK